MMDAQADLRAAFAIGAKPGGVVALAAFNAGYAHSSFSMRCVKAALLSECGAALTPDAVRILEFDSQSTALQCAERILSCAPDAVGFSVYIWNVLAVAAVMRVMRAVSPGTRLVVGGPQIVRGEDREGVQALADAVFFGEADAPERPAVSPYDFYDADDLAHRVIYAEASRGCPFACEYCVSALSGGIRHFPRGFIIPEFEKLIARGVRRFKFLDRSFNCGGAESLAVLEFFRSAATARPSPDWRLHFEFTPDPPPPEWREALLGFPPGTLHLEVGIQTFNEEVARRIRRPLRPAAAGEALRFLIGEARASVHADLIAGLPGEGLESFAAGFDRLLAFKPDELQVGILKNLPGAAVSRHDGEFGVVWNPLPPYQILSCDFLDFAALRALERFSKCWDSLFNRGRFRRSVPLLWRDGGGAFWRVWRLAERIFTRCGRLHALSPKTIAEVLREFLVDSCSVPAREASAAIEYDFRELPRHANLRP